MANQRDRILKLKSYLEESGIVVNIGKNKARGNKGIFVTRNKNFRIDIAKSLDDEAALSTLIHEYAHYIHYKYDKTLNSFDFIFPNFDDEIHEELLKVSVNLVPKDTAIELFHQKDDISKCIRNLSAKLKEYYPDFKISKPCTQIEKTLKMPFKYLLKYDRVKIFNKIYSIEDAEINTQQRLYVELKSRQRCLKRINSRITKLNNYYNKPTELIARFVEMYFTNYEKTHILAPKCCKIFNEKIKNNDINEFCDLKYIL